VELGAAPRCKAPRPFDLISRSIADNALESAAGPSTWIVACFPEGRQVEKDPEVGLSLGQSISNSRANLAVHKQLHAVFGRVVLDRQVQEALSISSSRAASGGAAGSKQGPS